MPDNLHINREISVARAVVRLYVAQYGTDPILDDGMSIDTATSILIADDNPKAAHHADRIYYAAGLGDDQYYWNAVCLEDPLADDWQYRFPIRHPKPRPAPAVSAAPFG